MFYNLLNLETKMNIAQIIIDLCNDKLTSCTYLTYESVLEQELTKLQLSISDIKNAAEACYPAEDAWQKEICRSFVIIHQGILNAKASIIELRESANHIIDEMSSWHCWNQFIQQCANDAYNTNPKAFSYSRTRALKEMTDISYQYRTSIDSRQVQSVLRAIKSMYQNCVDRNDFIPRGCVERGVFEYVAEEDLDYLLQKSKGEFVLQDVENYVPTIKNEHVDKYIEGMLKVFVSMHISDDLLYYAHTEPEVPISQYLTSKLFRPSTEPTEKEYTYDLFPGNKIYSTKVAKPSSSSSSQNNSAENNKASSDSQNSNSGSSSSTSNSAKQKNSFCDKYDNLPLLLKLIMHILFGSIISCVYRLVRHSQTKERSTLICGIFAIIPPFSIIIYLIDLITIIYTDEIAFFTE